MQTADKRQETIRTLQSSVFKLKQCMQDILSKLEMQKECHDWPSYLNTLALCASELSEIRKMLESDRFTNEETHVLVPTLLNPEPDPELARLTEDRFSLFNHDSVPQYLRTKLDPKIESQCSVQTTRATTMPSATDQIIKLTNLSNRALDRALTETGLLKQELDSDFNDRQIKSMVNRDDQLALLTALNYGTNISTH